MLVTSIFSFSHNIFYLSKTILNFSVTFILLSANAFNLEQSKILSLFVKNAFHISEPIWVIVVVVSHYNPFPNTPFWDCPKFKEAANDNWNNITSL